MNQARLCALAFLLLFTTSIAYSQSTATLQGTVTDTSGAVVPNADVKVTNVATNVTRTTKTDSAGNYMLSALPIGSYTVQVAAPGMAQAQVSNLVLQVSRVQVQNITLKPAEVTQSVTVTSEAPIVERGNISVGTVIGQRTVQEVPLNGRHFVDLGLLAPGSVTPPQNGFLTFPLRGQGSFSFNSAGNREDTVNFMINGVNLNDMSQNQITFQPSINTVSEFKVDNSTPSAMYGRNSGAIVNIATRSGTNHFHGEVFEFIRNDAVDARNYFAKTIAPFKRNNFGANLGGPIFRNKTFFFVSYEGLRQRQGLTINSGVLSLAQRASVTDPSAQKLLTLIPPPNAVGSKGQALFLGAATAPVNIDQWTGDVSHNFSDKDRLHGYYAFQRDQRQEPTLQGNTIPGFGDTRAAHRQILTLNEAHVFGTNTVNEARLGFNRIHISFTPNALLDPAAFGINSGVSGPLGIPQIQFQDLGLNFGGPALFPQGRGDTTGVLADDLSWLHGKHSFHFGAEARRFLNDNFSSDLGTLTFNTVANFAAGTANAFVITPGSQPSRIATNAIAGYVQDSYHVEPWLTLELGLRYDWNGTPVEARDRFVNFDPVTSSLVIAPTPYHQNDKNFQPRVGFIWDLLKDGTTVLRGGYAIVTDQPVTNMVSPLASNPPFATPISFSGTAPLATLFTTARAAGSLSPFAVNSGFDNPYVESWNLNLQRALTPTLGLMVAYVGNRGIHLRVLQNTNQPISGARPFTTVSPASPIDPGAKLNNINTVASDAFSYYNALWVSVVKNMGRGLQFNANYTWSHAIDTNSLSSTSSVAVQNSYNIAGDKGSSDFDARHRFALSFVYDFPWQNNRFVAGWELSSITQIQSGNPINIVAGSPAGLNLTGFTGVVNTLRPDVVGPISVIGSPNQWFSNTICDPRVGCPAGAVFAVPISPSGAIHFGDLGRNSVVGPGFIDSDVALAKTTKLTERLHMVLRIEAFNWLNHPNFGQPGRVATPGSPTFGVIQSTRFPTGDFGSSRQLQAAAKLVF